MSLAQIFEQYPDRRYIMFGGKGGLGKTTFSAATAYYLAKQGKKVLVFSVDPAGLAHRYLQADIFGKGAVEIMPNLYAQEIDADRRIKEYQEEIRQKILDMYGMDKIPEEIESYIQAAAAEPAMEESAIFDEVVDIVVKGGYDYYIYDLVPLGHALYYLSMASVYDEWIDKITKLRAADARVRPGGRRDPAGQGARRGRDPEGAPVHQGPHQQVLQHPDRQGEDRLLLRAHCRRDDHHRHAEGGRALRQVRRAALAATSSTGSCPRSCRTRTSPST